MKLRERKLFMLNLLKRFLDRLWLRSNPVTSQSAGPIAEQRLKEHQAGWIVYYAGEPILELSFVRIDPPFYRFRVKEIGPSGHTDTVLERSAMRGPDEKVVFKNRLNPEVVIKDESFFTNTHPDSTASIRDMRPPQ
jgi:hypothetical protein